MFLGANINIGYTEPKLRQVFYILIIITNIHIQIIYITELDSELQNYILKSSFSIAYPPKGAFVNSWQSMSFWATLYFLKRPVFKSGITVGSF